jgi:hypothetical protein
MQTLVNSGNFVSFYTLAGCFLCKSLMIKVMACLISFRRCTNKGPKFWFLVFNATLDEDDLL